jgi:hypothetical protein
MSMGIAKTKMNRGLNREAAGSLSVPDHKEPVIGDQTESDYCTSTLTELLLLVLETECSVLLDPAIIV